MRLRKRRLNPLYIPLVVILLLSGGGLLFSQNIEMDEVYARDEFRWGVRSFHSGNFNKALLSFEKALSYTPDDTMIQEWLGRAYYRSGFTETALDIWTEILDQGEGSALLQNTVDVISYRSGLGRELHEIDRYVISAEIQGKQEEYNLFLRPSSILTMDDGSFYIVAYGSNEVVLFNTNGALKKRFRGGVYGFDHPFDIVESSDGNFFVSEFEGDRIVKCNNEGYILNSFGSSGRGPGELIGPQFLASDGKGYIYITDYGNRRVCKFDEEGNFILSFGRRTSRFQGLRAPSGILVRGGRVYVSDTVNRLVAVFDESGNFMTTLGEGRLESPEGITPFDRDRILIADSDRIVTLHLETEKVTLLSDLEGRGEKVLQAELDENGNIIVADFNKGDITILSELSSLYAGLYVEIDRVHSIDHPGIIAGVTVSTRLGKPVTGLDQSNFIITENRGRVYNQALHHAVNEMEYADITLLIDKSPEMKEMETQIREAVTQLSRILGDRGTIRIVSASESPSIEADENTPRSDLLKAGLAGEYSDKWRFDLGLRLAASSLLDSTARRAVVFITRGDLTDDSFSQYGLLESKQYLENNHIPFYSLYLDSGNMSDELNYLTDQTDGGSFELYQPEGIAPLVTHILEYRSGTYYLTYDSASYSDFGRALIAMEVEVLHFKRSGRDESAYFAPLEY